MLWIEAQSTPVIALLVFGVCYMLTAAIFCLAAILSRRAVAQDLKAVVPVTLTPLGVILGLVIVFLASRVWMNLDRAVCTCAIQSTGSPGTSRDGDRACA
jgi:hypothetical protein